MATKNERHFVSNSIDKKMAMVYPANKYELVGDTPGWGAEGERVGIYPKLSGERTTERFPLERA